MKVHTDKKRGDSAATSISCHPGSLHSAPSFQCIVEWMAICASVQCTGAEFIRCRWDIWPEWNDGWCWGPDVLSRTAPNSLPPGCCQWGVREKTSHSINLQTWAVEEFAQTGPTAMRKPCALHRPGWLPHTHKQYNHRHNHRYKCRTVTGITEPLQKLHWRPWLQYIESRHGYIFLKKILLSFKSCYSKNARSKEIFTLLQQNFHSTAQNICFTMV